MCFISSSYWKNSLVDTCLSSGKRKSVLASSDYGEIQLFKPYCMGWCLIIKDLFCSIFFFSCKLPVLSYLPPDKCERQESKAGHCEHCSSWIMLRLLSKINTTFLNVNISWGEQSVSVIMSGKKMVWLLVNIWSPLNGFSMMSDVWIFSVKQIYTLWTWN